MEKRVLLATLLSLGFLFLWQYFMYKPQQQKQNIVSKEEYKEKSASVNVNYLKKEIEENLFEPYIVETDYLKIVFNQYGAGIREVYVKEDNNLNNFTAVIKGDKDFFYLYPDLKYKIEQKDEGKQKIVVFSLEDKGVKKIFKFRKDKSNIEENYLVDLDVQFKNEKKIVLSFDQYIYSDKFSNEPNSVHIGYITKMDDKKEILLVKKLDKFNSPIENYIEWLSVSGRYFIFALILDKTLPVLVSVDKINKLPKKIVVSFSKPISSYSFKLLFAPKKILILEKLDKKLIQTVEWGTFAPLSKLFYNILVFFYKIFKNYGLAIVGLTIILQIITFPLTYNSIKAAAKMRQIQPQIQLLQKVYKDDPKRLNMEIMNLYKEKKVNPFGGCLPLLLQIPIFWALFTMLRNTYDLRGASFVLWITDLSQPDRLVIPGLNIGIPVLVILMGATMFLQQFISGGFSDPQQRSFAIMMPVIFTIMFFNFPSGLVLYWFINNIFSISIQVVVNKSLKDK